MKKVINGKVYDTETAELVARWSNGQSTSDFDYCAEDLYRKRTGEFFIHGDGGASSKYAVSYGNGFWGGGEKITPLTYEAAQKWAEEHLSGEKYEAIFGEVAEDESKTAVTLSLSAAAVERAKRTAAQKGISLSALIESLI